MHPHDGGTHLHSGQCSRQAGRQATLDRPARDGPQHGLARHADQYRSDRCPGGNAAVQRQVVHQRLAEAETRVQADALRRHTGIQQRLAAVHQEAANLGHHVGIDGVGLHGGGRVTQHVHGDETYLAARHGCPRLRGAKAADVVDDAGPGGNDAGHRARMTGIDGQGHVQSGQRLDHRGEPGPLLVRRHGLRTGPGGLGANVDDVGTFVDHPACRSDGHGRITMTSPVGEGVVSDV